MKEILRTSKAPIFKVPLSQGTKFGNRVFPSGMVGASPDTLEVVGGFEEQTRKVMENLLYVSDEGGMSPQDFIKCTPISKIQSKK